MPRCNAHFAWRPLAAAVLALTLFATPSAAQDKPLKKVTIAMGSSLINVGYPTETLPLYLGFWKAEGYDVELIPAGGSLQAIQQMVGGNAQFAEVNSTPVVQAAVTHGIPIRIVMTNTVIDWSIAVPADSPIKEAKDFRGKVIGVFSLATGNLALLRSYLAKAGVKESEFELASIGIGAPAAEALRSGKVHALFYWGSAIAAFGNTLKLRKLAGEDWKTYPDYSLSVMQATADKDPAMVVGIARGMAKATTFALANPDCARTIYVAHNKQTLAPGVTAETQAVRDMNIVSAKLEATEAAFRLGGGKLTGKINVQAYDGLQKFLNDSKQIDKVIPSDRLLTQAGDLSAKINDFDADAIKKSARECKL